MRRLAFRVVRRKRAMRRLVFRVVSRETAIRMLGRRSIASRSNKRNQGGYNETRVKELHDVDGVVTSVVLSL